jgi:hypothetical protein|tara:strand:- start:451 stop:735 length:285 start_codon:yes stop_codon:yes gene_type:complete
MMNPYEFMSSLFSEEGFKVSDFTLRVQSETSIDMYKNEDSIIIDFQENQPTITVKKIIKFKLTVEGIELNKDGGLLKLDRFPDIPFKYEWLQNE